MGEGITEEVALELHLERWKEIWQADKGTCSSGSMRGGEGRTWGKVAPGTGSFPTTTKADSASLTFPPSNLSCLSDGWAGRAVSQRVRDSESAGSACFWQAVCLDLLLRKGRCSESLCYQRSLGLLGHVCFCALAGMPCQAQSFVIFIIQPLVTPSWRRDGSSWSLGNSVHLMIGGLGILRWAGIFGFTVGTWWVACELGWSMRQFDRDKARWQVSLSSIGLHPCIQSLMQQTFTDPLFCFRCWAFIRMAATFSRNKPMNTVACEGAMSEGSSGTLRSMEEHLCPGLG